LRAGFCCPTATAREGVCGIRNHEVCDSNSDCCSGICVRNLCRAAPGQTGAACDGGDTADCAAGLNCCGDPASQTGFSCTDVNVDRANCGACVADGGTVCPTGETCTGGICTGNSDAVCLSLPDICANTTAPCDPSAGGTCYCTTTIEGHTRCASVVSRGNCGDARCTNSSECPGKPRPGSSEVYGPEAFCGRVDGCCGQGTGLCFEPCWTQQEGETCAAGIECESGTCCGPAGEMICCGFGGVTGESETCFAGTCCPAEQVCEGNTICCACPNACVGDTCLDAGPQLSGELTSQSSTFDRCDGSDTGFFYDTYTYDHGGGWLSINLRGTAAGGGSLRDSYIYLYRGFDPADPCSNRVAEDDDSGCGFESSIVGNFPADRYVFVVTTYDAGDTGSYTLEFNRCLDCPA